MTAHLRHQLTGYDRESDELVIERDIDPGIFKRIRKIAKIGPDDPDAAYTYSLEASQLRAISDLMGLDLDNDRYEFFVEPVAASRTPV